MTGMRSTWVMSMARHCARRVRQLSRLLFFTAQPGGGVAFAKQGEELIEKEADVQGFLKMW